MDPDKAKEEGEGAPPPAVPVKQTADPKEAAAAKGTDPGASAAHDDSSDPEPKPDDRGWVHMPMRTFLKRVSRMNKRDLKKHFGHDDIELVVKEREELKILKTEKEERERKEMSERQRLETDLKKERDLREVAEKKAEDAEARVLARTSDKELVSAALKYVDHEDAEDLLDKLARFVTKNPRAIRKPKDADAWIKAYVAEHPKWAKGSADKGGAEEKKGEEKARRKVEVDTTGGGNKQAPPARPPGQKAVKDMTKAEATAYARSLGITLP